MFTVPPNANPAVWILMRVRPIMWLLCMRCVEMHVLRPFPFRCSQSKLRKLLRVSWTAKENERVGSWQSWSKEGTVRRRQNKKASILWSHHDETRELPGERDNARNNARCTQARKTTHGLDGQHQNVDRTPSERVNRNDRGQEKMEKVRPWCGQPSDRGRLKNRTEQNQNEVYIGWQWRNFVPYLCQLVFAAILWVKLL